MKKRYKFLVVVLAFVMIIQAIPITFLETNAASGASVQNEPVTKTYSTDLKSYVEENNGQLLFISEFSEDNNAASLLNIGTKLSLVTKGDSTSLIQGGYLVNTCRPIVEGCTDNDPFTDFSLSDVKAGEAITTEIDFMISENNDNPGNKINIVCFRDRGEGRNRKDLQISLLAALDSNDNVRVLTYENDNEVTIFTTKVGQLVKIKTTVDPINKKFSIYVDGILARNIDITSKMQASDYQLNGNDYPIFSEARFMQISNKGGKGQGKIDFLAIYKGVNTPYLMDSESHDFRDIDKNIVKLGGRTGGIVQAYTDQGGQNNGLNKKIGTGSISFVRLHEPIVKRDDGFSYVSYATTRPLEKDESVHRFCSIFPGTNAGETFIMDGLFKFNDYNGAFIQAISETLNKNNSYTQDPRAFIDVLGIYGGYLTAGGENIYKINPDTEYRIQVAIETSKNLLKIFVNGKFCSETKFIKDSDIQKFFKGDPAKIKFCEIRSFQNNTQSGELGIKELYWYSLPVGSAPKFLTENDMTFTGFKNDYAYVKGVKQDFHGFNTVNDITYYYNNGGKISKNETFIDGIKTIKTASNGTVSISTPSEVKNVVSVEDWANASINGKIEYSDGIPTGFDVCGLKPVFLNVNVPEYNKCSHVRLSFYVGENNLEPGKDQIGIHLSTSDKSYKITSYQGSTKDDFVIKSLDSTPTRYKGTEVFSKSFNGKTYRIYKETLQNNQVQYYARYWRYKQCKINLCNYEVGWHTVEFENTIDFHTEKVELNTNGWEYVCSTQKGGGAVPADVVAKIPFKIGSIRLLNYAPDTSKNGIQGDFLYKNGNIQTGWYENNGAKYYFSSVDGKMAKGRNYVSEEGLWYEFGNDGKLIGKLNGKYTDELVYKENGKKAITVQADRMFSNGVLRTGFMDLEGSQYFADRNTGEILKNQLAEFDGNSDTVKHCGADGKITEYKLNLDSLVNVNTEEGTAKAEYDYNGEIKTANVNIQTWYGQLGMTKKDGKYYLAGAKNEVRYFGQAGEKGYRYFDADGAMVTNLQGVKYFKKHGIIDSGLVATKDGQYFFRNKEMQKNTWCAINKNLAYRFDANGIKVEEEIPQTPYKSAVVLFYTFDGTKLGETTYYSKDSKVVFPSAPIKIVYEFSSWNLTEQQIINEINSGKTQIQVIANYTKKADKFNIAVKNGEKTAEVTETVNIGDKFTVKAEVVQGKKFAYWVNSDGVICSYNETLIIYASKNETYEAKYVPNTETVDKKGVIVNKTNSFTDGEDNYIEVLFERTLPENAELVEFYVERDFTEDFNGKQIKKAAGNLTAISYKLKISGKENARYYIRSGLKYELNGAVVTVYSDILGLSFKQPKNVLDTQKKKLNYRDFGAVGNGIVDDFEAIKKTHEEANRTGAMVVGEKGKTYNLGSHTTAIPIKTDCDWTGVTFKVDDRNIAPSDKARTTSIFVISRDGNIYKTDKIKTLYKGQKNVGITFETKCMLLIQDSNKRQYIRYGVNENQGSATQEVIVVDKNGNVDPSTPIMWDYKTVTSCEVIPIDDIPILIKGGTFITYANRAPRQYTYYSRNIAIRRSNVILRDITHLIKEETDTGAPYGGFFDVNRCNNVLMENLVITGHKTYRLDNNGPVNNMGTYELGGSLANNITWKGLTQTNNLTDGKYWGVMGTNYCKNLTYDNCKVSRFDAHCGVYNATIINSELKTLSIIGAGTLRVENTIMHNNTVVGLRGDYGSTWDGDVIFKDITVNNNANVILIGGSWTNHNFGYDCHLPTNIYIDGIMLKDKRKEIYVIGQFEKTGLKIDEPTVNGAENNNPLILSEQIVLESNKEGNVFNNSVNPLFNKIPFVKK